MTITAEVVKSLLILMIHMHKLIMLTSTEWNNNDIKLEHIFADIPTGYLRYSSMAAPRT